MALELRTLTVTGAVLRQFEQGATNRLAVTGPWGSAKTAIAFQTAQALDTSLLVVTPGRIEAEAAFEDLCTFAGEDRCALFPAWEVLPTDVMDPADDIVAERMDTLRRMAAAMDRKEPVYIVASIRALLQHVVGREQLIDQCLPLSTGDEHDMEDLLARLVSMGYRRELMVEQRGEMSVRGGIFDVFPISAELPYRIEFFGDEIESIRKFEPETQRSVELVNTIELFPRSEKALLRDQAANGREAPLLADYVSADALVMLDEPLNLAEEGRKQDAQLCGNPYFTSWAAARERLSAFRQLALSQMTQDHEQTGPHLKTSFHSIAGWAGDTEGFWAQLEEWNRDRYSVVLLCNNPGERKRLSELMEERGYTPGAGSFDLRLALGRLHAGFTSPDDRLAVLSEREIFGRHYVRRVRRRFEAGAGVTGFSDLKAGDYVVHAVHGIGRYDGLRRFAEKGGDFLALYYSGGDVLYVPATQIDQVQKYVAGEGGVPKLDRLGGASWNRTKRRVKRSIRDMTEELVKLYAAREAHRGHAFNPDTHWQYAFEDAFEYDETPDQARAIAETKTDMQSPRPMDRLVCGDVGFGKTEVALRAAFKAVMDNRQVAVLVPTTVLAQQHYATFSSRLADYPVRVAVLSRFRGPRELKETADQLRSGEVDIVIGTHRLLSKDIRFKDLGLVVIDEEQRFGVAQKEKLKQLRTHVDVLTMSATPIPRTLHFSLMGLRDMSVINTAPNDRLPIHTCIETFDPEVIQEAVRRELGREGQVFYLHNRVQTIAAVANMVRKLVPEARVCIAHGQMPERQLERIMGDFIERRADVLVCTTIIGSGLDIPNANTIIVDRADRFGLAELYQIRGRVGRYKHRAFAYLLVPDDRVPSEDAQKRLKALEEFSTLGAGYRIALRDLEIRGCGNILGPQQHGQIAAVGYDTYCQLIREAVSELKGQPVVQRTLPAFEVAVDAYIPEDYVPSEAQKITLYKRIAALMTVEEVEEMVAELSDRFGRPPAPVKRLLDIMRVRAFGADAGARLIAAGNGSVEVEFQSAQGLTRKRANGLRETFGAAVEFSWQDRPSVKYRFGPETGPLEGAEQLLRALAQV